LPEQTQWLHVLIDVATEAPRCQRPFGPRCWAGRSVSRGRGIRNSGAIQRSLLFQKLGSDDPGTGVRAHIDLGADDLEAEAGRLVGLGAERLGPGRGWIVLRDPVGMIFCVTGNAPDNP
jgi:hypothetical protein